MKYYTYGYTILGRWCQAEKTGAQWWGGAAQVPHTTSRVGMCFARPCGGVYSGKGQLAHRIAQARSFAFEKTAEATARNGRRRQQTLGSRQAIPGEKPHRGRHIGVSGGAGRGSATPGSDAGTGGFVRAGGPAGPRGGLLRAVVRHAGGAAGREQSPGDL